MSIQNIVFASNDNPLNPGGSVLNSLVQSRDFGTYRISAQLYSWQQLWQDCRVCARSPEPPLLAYCDQTA